MKRAGKESFNSRLTYTVPEVAKLLGVNKIAAYRLAQQKNFPSIRIGRRIVVSKAGLERWLDSQSNGQ